MATSLKIDDRLKGRVQHLASQRRLSSHWIMLEAIQQYVEREEVRESFKQEALASWTALRLALAEMLSWWAPNTTGEDSAVTRLPQEIVPAPARTRTIIPSAMRYTTKM